MEKTNFNINKMLEEISQGVLPDEFPYETLKQCGEHYCPPIYKYITCQQFGNPDGMDGGCQWCMEMTPIQWHMCLDECHLRNYVNINKMSKYDAIKKLENYKNS